MVKRSAYFVLGIVLVFLGIVGFLLPILPGFIPFTIGVILLSKSSKTCRSYLLRLKTRFPKQYDKFHTIREKMSKHK